METNIEVCYTCKNCQVVKQLCTLKQMKIKNIRRDACSMYSEREMKQCELCGDYFVDLVQHVTHAHNIGYPQYKVMVEQNDFHGMKVRKRVLF